MLEHFGLIIAAGAVSTTPQSNSISINLVAEVPVTCSSAAVLDTNNTSSGLAVLITGACNSDHFVRLIVPEGAPERATASLNGEVGSRVVDAFEFTRPGYFDGHSLVELDYGRGANASMPAPQALRVEISPF